MASDAELRQRIVELPLPFITAAASLNRHQSGSETAIFSQVCGLIHVQNVDAVNRDGQPKLTGSRIGDVGGIHDQRCPVLRSRRENQAAARLANHARGQGQNIGHC